MKVLFVGPSLHRHGERPSGIEFRPPASHGDLLTAVADGASAIGLVDGLYESVAAVWHKEILFALSKGVVVLGAASMGALRAAECHAFGMRPVGEIAHRYVCGSLDDDAAVAQLHAPAELGFIPLTEALVDCEATLTALGRSGELGPEEAAALWGSATRLFFKDRTWPNIVEGSALMPDRKRDLVALFRQRKRSIKREDAILLLSVLDRLPDERCNPPKGWHLALPMVWDRFLRAPASEAHRSVGL